MIIDIGANIGEFSLEMAKRNPKLTIIAVEPIPYLVEKTKQVAALMKLDNIEIYECAIDNREHETSFNLAAHHDNGVSSLLDFNVQNIQADEYWKDREDLFFNKKISVQVKTLESLLKNLPQENIEFIKVDAQGVDLNVLKSAGKYIPRIQAGMLEVSLNSYNSLYEGDSSFLYESLSWLSENDFTPYALKPNDPASNEFNLYFCRKGVDFQSVEQRLKLRNCHLYDGKNFWHYPSDTLLTIDVDIKKHQAELSRHKEETARYKEETARYKEETARYKEDAANYKTKLLRYLSRFFR